LRVSFCSFFFVLLLLARLINYLLQPSQNMPSIASIAQAEEVQKTSPEQAIPLYQSILAAAGTGMLFTLPFPSCSWNKEGKRVWS